MSDQSFRFAVTISDDSLDRDAVLVEEFVTFDPLDTDKYGYNERVIEHVEAWLKRAKYDAQQIEIEAEQNADEERADHFYKLRKSEFV